MSTSSQNSGAVIALQPVVTRPVPRLLSTAILSTAIRGLGPLSALLLTLLLARMLGAAETGAFYLLATLMTTAAIIAKFGFDNALQRFVGPAAASNDWASVHGLYRQALRTTASLSLLLAAVMVLLSGWIASALLHQPEQQPLVFWMGLTVIPFTLLGVHAAMLKAVGRPIWGGFIEAAALPVITIVLVGLGAVEGERFTLNVNNIAFAFFLGALGATLLGGWLLLRRLPRVTTPQAMPRKVLRASCLPLTVVELLNYAILWMPMVILGAMATTSDAGLYNIAQRLAGQLGLLLLVFAAITAPRFAAHHQAGEEDQLLDLAGKATRGLSLLGLPPALLLLLWPTPFLAMFGEAFVAAEAVLRILAFGQLVNIVTGPVGYLLAMTGHERLLRNTLVITALMTLLLSLLWIPAHGAVGAAWAVAIPMIVQNLTACLLLRQRLGFPLFLLLARTAK
jgi:O-antigen/teichoic acid export membrane protein